MDKKNSVIGVLLLVAAFGAFYWSSKNAPKPQPQPVPATAPQDTGESQGLTAPAAPIVPLEAPPVTAGQPLIAEAQAVFQNAETYLARF